MKQTFKSFSISHIGVITDNLKKSIYLYFLMGYRIKKESHNVLRGIETVLLEKENEPFVELVKLTNNNSKLMEMYRMNGSNSHYTCYEVNEIQSAIELFRENDFTTICDLEDAVNFENHKNCFLYNKEIGLLELIEAQ